MKEKLLLLFLLFNISFSYYSLILNKIYLPLLPNNSYTPIETFENETSEQYLDELEEYNDLPLNNSELNSINQTYIKTKNINSELYTAGLYLGSNKQYFTLLLSTTDDLLTVSSINCTLCNVSNKYNADLSISKIKLNKTENQPNLVNNINYDIFQDSVLIPSESINHGVAKKININIQKINIKVIELDSSGFLNSDIIDGILSLNYNNDTENPRNNFIRELYNEGYISSPSFSIIVTSANINRLYLGDIMENEYISNYINTSMNKNECQIIDNDWRCQLKGIEYNALKRSQWEKLEYSAHSTLTFNLKDNKLTIPDIYYNLIVVSYKYVIKERKSYATIKKQYNKHCTTFEGIIYCTCYDKDDFGIVTFHFENDSTLDIDLRDYVYFDNQAFYYKCRVDILLSRNNEFKVGLKGLNNTILSFNMEEKKIKFFHKKKFDKNFFGIPLIILIIFVIIITIMKQK